MPRGAPFPTIAFPTLALPTIAKVGWLALLLAIVACSSDAAPGDDGAVDGPRRDGAIDSRRDAEDARADLQQPDLLDCSDPQTAVAQPGSLPDGVIPGALRSHATLHSIALDWPLEGDADHDATCSVRYRKKGDCAWLVAPPLFRVDYAWYYNNEKATAPENRFSGSLLFLSPATTYQVHLQLTDPDGGKADALLEVTTRTIPGSAGAGGGSGKTYHVVPGSGGGTGSQADPFVGVGAADALAKPGDTLLLHAGHYVGQQRLRAGGAAGAYVHWKAAGDGKVIFDRASVEASHVWLDDIDFEKPAAATYAGLTTTTAKRTNVAITSCRFADYNYAIVAKPSSEDWIITDNEIVGDRDPTISDFGGEGVELNRSSGHVVAYNRISRVADGVSYCKENCDIYGNDIFDTSDDGVEPDYGFANVRVWGNRIANVKNFALSFQPQKLGPWYFVHNQIIGSRMFKFRTQDRFVVVNNTFVTWGTVVDMAQFLIGTLSRNNLYISADGAKAIWIGWDGSKSTPQFVSPPVWKPDWRSDVDYDGFDWGGAVPAFKWNGKHYADLKAFSAAVGIEANGRAVDKHKTFASYDIPTTPGDVGPKLLLLAPGGDAVDKGAVVPNLCDVYSGSAPDLGAHELGRPTMHFGPRDAKAMVVHATYWARH